MESFFPTITEAAERLIAPLARVLLPVGSVFSAASLLSAFLIAVISLAWPRWGRGRRLRLKVVLRALFPRRFLRGASSKADGGLFLFNIFAAAALIGWTLLSTSQISHQVSQLLARVFGALPDTGLPQAAVRAIATVALFVAYEFAYWLYHFLSHKVPVLWDFHKVHHTAEVLSPLTAFRVHPIDTLLFANVTAVLVGLTGGILHYVLGAGAAPLTLSGSNAILVSFIFLTVHLQHSHVWISFTGVWGRIFLSPAHHQIHHSANPVHFNRNFGSCLSLWDWAFGTLHVPARAREPLTFGAELAEGAASPHSVTGVLIAPFLEAARRIPGVGAPPTAAVATLVPDRPRR